MEFPNNLLKLVNLPPAATDLCWHLCGEEFEDHRGARESTSNNFGANWPLQS